MGHLKNHWLLVILPILGIGFWFFVGFPFADRNESYVWITYLQKYSSVGIIQNAIPSIRGFRPLAQVTAWCLYHLSGGNGILVQLINFVLLCAAIWTMIALTHTSKLRQVRLLYLMIGLIYFPSFYYIFNLHGIFYSVILMLIALFLKADEDVLTNWKKWLSISFVLVFFHPIILIFYIAYGTGWLIEKQQVGSNKIIPLAIVLVVLLIYLKLSFPFPIFTVIDIRNLVGTMRNVETYNIIKAFTLLLCSFTFLNKTRQQRVLLLAIVIAYLSVAIIYDLPFLFLLGFLIVFSLVIERKWSLACLVAATISFPLTVGSGAPTKASIFIFMLPYLLPGPISFSLVIKDWIPKAIALAMLAGITCCAILIRLEVKIPLLSSLIAPILAEKGKTYQLEKVLKLAQQQTPHRRIRFLQEKPGNIRDRGQPKQRDYFPPTKQEELDTYQQYVLPEHALDSFPTWYMAFGTELPRDTLMLVYKLHEKNCKPAYVYEALHH